MTASDFTDGKITILELLIKTQQAPSKGEARRLVDQGGVFVGDEKVSAISASYTADEINGYVDTRPLVRTFLLETSFNILLLS